MRKLGRGNKVDIRTAEAILEDLGRWKQSLPEAIQPSASGTWGTDLSTGERQFLIAKLHMACIYYFSVLLVTRPFLIASLLGRYRSSSGICSPAATTNTKVSRLAQACIASAKYITEACSKSVESGVIFGSMTILQ